MTNKYTKGVDSSVVRAWPAASVASCGQGRHWGWGMFQQNSNVPVYPESGTQTAEAGSVCTHIIKY